MLWYKAWLESRARFLFCLIGLQCFMAYMVLDCNSIMEDFKRDPATFNYQEYIWRSLAYRYQIAWVFCVFFLGFGGLLREKALGSADFTLSLPVSRRRLLGVRAALGAGQSLILCLVPYMTVPFLSLAVGRSYPLTQTLVFAFVMTVGGMAYFCFGFFLSAVLAGEYAAPGVGILLIIGVNTFSRQFPMLEPFNPQDFLSGRHYLDKSTYFVHGSLPWVGIAASLGCAIALLLFGTLFTEKREF